MRIQGSQLPAAGTAHTHDVRGDAASAGHRHETGPVPTTRPSGPRRATTTAAVHSDTGSGPGTSTSRPAITRLAGGRAAGAEHRSAPLRVDAQRNLEHVLRAAREVFGELGYGAPMEDVARRARVGVGTVYRRFPSKDVLVQRIAAEETEHLTQQARAALGHEEEPWAALSRFLRTAAASGSGRLLPPGVLRIEQAPGVPEEADAAVRFGSASRADSTVNDAHGGADSGPAPVLRHIGTRWAPEDARGATDAQRPTTAEPVLSSTAQATTADMDGSAGDAVEGDSGSDVLLDVVGRLVDRAREAGQLREGITVSDVLLVIATGAPSLPDHGQQRAASARLLEILLDGLRAHSAH